MLSNFTHVQLLGSTSSVGGAAESSRGRRLVVAAAGAVIGVGLAAAMAAGPAMADPVPDPPPPAISDFTTLTSLSGPSAPAPSSNGSHLVTPDVTGERQTFTRGGVTAWSSDTFEWYWSGSKMTSSSGFQTDGYIFPNTVSLKGIHRTLDISSEHLWRASAAVGAGVNTPWGVVDVYSDTITDYFTIKPGKLTHSDS